MKKSAKGEGGRKAARGQLWLHLPSMVSEALYDTVIGAGLAWTKFWKWNGWRCAAHATNVWPIVRRCVRDT